MSFMKTLPVFASCISCWNIAVNTGLLAFKMHLCAPILWLLWPFVNSKWMSQSVCLTYKSHSCWIKSISVCASGSFILNQRCKYKAYVWSGPSCLDMVLVARQNLHSPDNSTKGTLFFLDSIQMAHKGLCSLNSP